MGGVGKSGKLTVTPPPELPPKQALRAHIKLVYSKARPMLLNGLAVNTVNCFLGYVMVKVSARFPNIVEVTKEKYER